MTRSNLKSYVTYHDDVVNGTADDAADMSEWDYATMKTTRWTLTPNLRIYLFPDLLIFYGFLAFLTVLGCAARLVPRLARLLHTRFVLVDDKLPAKWWWNWIGAPPWSMSVGGLVVLTAFILTSILFITYWGYDHAYDYNKTSPSAGGQFSSNQIAARTLGQVANFLMALLVFPISKNSILTAAFGVAWEQVVFVHVLLGEAFVAVCVAHMLLWWVVFAENAFPMPNTILSVPTWFSATLIKECPYHPGSPHHYDWMKDNMYTSPEGTNWTIPLITLVFWVFLVCTGVFAQNYFRRNHFEVFYYLHHVYLVLFAAVLWHAASAWYYLIGGLSLWFVDRCIRVYQRTRWWKVSHVQAFPEETITLLKFVPQHDLIGRFPDFTFSCGQYLYVNIPAVAPHEWHPFTISSAPSDRVVNCHIKDMGPDSFTGKLHALAQLDPDPSSLVVNIDGPYGEWFDHSKFDRVLLVAGGIGVTPVHSIFRELWHLTGSGHCRCQCVNLVWSVRNPAAIDPFLATLQEIRDNSRDGRFTFSLHVTAADGDRNEYQGLPIMSGRVPIATVVDQFAASAARSDISHVFFCGPGSLAADTDSACLRNNLSFHKETFAF